MELWDLIATPHKGERDARGGFTATAAVLDYLLQDKKLFSLVIEDDQVEPETVVRSEPAGNQYLFPPGNPHGVHRVALAPQPSDPKAYLLPLTPEEDALFLSCYSSLVARRLDEAAPEVGKAVVKRLKEEAMQRSPFQITYKGMDF